MRKVKENGGGYDTGGEGQDISNAGAAHKYFAIIPNMVDDSDLDPFERTLYFHYVRVGECWESVETTATRTHMSVGKVSEVRRALEDKGWITVGVSDFGTKLVKVLDRWTENVIKYSQGESPSLSETDPSPHETTPSRGETKKNPLKKEPIEVERTTPPTDFEKVWKEVEQCFVMLSPSEFYKLRELWEQFPDFARHNYAIDRARHANPKQFRFYLKDFASFDPNVPRTWGQTLVPSNVPNAPPPLVPAVPMHPIALRAAAQNGETIRQTLERLLQTGTIKEEMYHATREKLLALLETPTRTVPLPTG